MTDTRIVLKDLSYVLPDGRQLFSNLNEQFDSRPTGLVGRNGIGKTLLARILAGQLPPTSGQCLHAGSIHYLSQQPLPQDDSTLADLAGVKQTLGALQRIQAGSTALADFDAVGDDWDMPQRLRQALEQHQLDHLDACTPAKTLSGGEAMRVSLMGAFLANADTLILDEPSNHLDRTSRQSLLDQLRRWKGGLIVISHDRELLDSMERIVELSSLGLSSYGGNYTFYVEAREQERRNALQNLDALKHERRRSEQAIRLQRERQERRQTRGKQLGKTANQAKILLDRQKERSESASGALRKQQVGSQARLSQRMHEAAQAVATETPIAVHAALVPRPYRRTLAELIDVKLPYLPDTSGPVSLTLSGQQRVGVEGNNGCGKSTLLRVLSGQLAPVDGKIRVTDEVAYLDQALEVLDPNQAILDQLKRAKSGAAEAGLRTRLAQLGLDAQKIMVPSGVLSGGERLKAALACVLYAERPAQLLMLDEPSNHLDLPSLEALEAMLREYRGALLVVSHDERLLERIQLTDRLRVTEKGWRLVPS